MYDKIRHNSSSAANARVDRKMEQSLEPYVSGRAANIDQRLKKLDKEWDIDRALEVNMPVIALSGIALGAMVHKRWLILPTVVLGFFLQHAIQGWCPPLPIFRRLGFRSRKEIERERYALKTIRGDLREENWKRSAYPEEALVKAMK